MGSGILQRFQCHHPLGGNEIRTRSDDLTDLDVDRTHPHQIITQPLRLYLGASAPCLAHGGDEVADQVSERDERQFREVKDNHWSGVR